MKNFLTIEFFRFVTLFLSGYLLGLLVIKKGVKVNYTRKIFHFILFFLPIFLEVQLPFETSLITIACSGCFFLICLLTLSKPIRNRVPFLNIIYTAIDRPEDRPLTMKWLFSQILATYIIIILMVKFLSFYNRVELIYITVIIAGIGDGLAEPVGVRFGKRKYSVSALFTKRKYIRTIEGSLCVFFSSILGIFLLIDQMNQTEFILSLILIPIVMTLTEAFSPHTWDAPFLFLVGGVMTISIIELSAMLNFALTIY